MSRIQPCRAMGRGLAPVVYAGKPPAPRHATRRSSSFASFYNGPLGGIVRRLLTQRIRARWRSAQGRQLMGLGFAVPYHRHVPRRGLAARCADAGQPGRAGVAARSGLAQRDGRRGHAAAGRCLRRPAARRALPGGRRAHAGRCCARCGACWRRKAGCCSSCPTGAAFGRASTPRRSATAGPTAARQLERLLTDALFTPLDGAARSSCRRSTGNGCCAGRRRSSASARRLARLRRRHHRRGAQGADGRPSAARPRRADCASSCRRQTRRAATASSRLRGSAGRSADRPRRAARRLSRPWSRRTAGSCAPWSSGGA